MRLVVNDLKRDWKRPWTILLYGALPLVMATLMAAVFGGRRGSSAMPTVQVALLDQDKDMLATGLSGAAEVLGEPLTEVRELFRQGSFPTETAVTGTASKSWEKLRNVRGYLFPPLVKFQTVEAAGYRISMTNPPSTRPEP